MAAPIILLVQFLSIYSVHSLSEANSPSNSYSVEAIASSDSCTYRVYRNQFLIQQYVGIFAPGTGWDDCTVTIQWTPQEDAIKWQNPRTKFSRLSQGIFKLPREPQNCPVIPRM
uniref:Uncharacterized protein n=1 Tax=Oscillatoriales cyanobacterium SpSt-402 TaxID=2282168 RepID=A0A832M2P4_9CYAN